MAAKVDLTEIVARRARISIDPEESAEEHLARLRADGRWATLEIVKAYVLFFAILIALLAIGSLCVWEGIFDPSASPDTKRWAQTTLSALFAGSISFVLGQMTAKKAK